MFFLKKVRLFEKNMHFGVKKAPNRLIFSVFASCEGYFLFSENGRDFQIEICFMAWNL